MKSEPKSVNMGKPEIAKYLFKPYSMITFVFCGLTELIIFTIQTKAW